MRRLLSFVFLCLLGCAQLWAAPVDSVRARQVADAFRATRGASYLDAVRVSSKQLGTEQVYVFNYGEQQGFVIVPANDALPPVLAYSFSSSFASDMADATHDWIDYYAASVADASSLGLDASDAVAQQWNRLLYGPAKPRKAGSVSPMLSVRWAQEPYYNRLCPEDPRSRQRVMVGCVAVAMGQIMHYWHHPLSGLGSHSYIDSVPGLLSADFHATTYLWDSMPDTLGRRSRLSQINAVSELLFHCGVSVDMAYSIDGSAAYASNYGNASLPSAQNAMPRYFDYKRTIASADRSDYSDSEWQALIVSELEDGRPVIYSGVDPEAGGHAFVCDGYEDDFFHFNWGWGGKCDGYYMLSNLAPALTPGATPRYSFVSAQSVVYGIEPNDHLRIDTARITFPIGGGSQTVSISSNADDSQTWTASATASWLHLSATTGFGEGRRTRVVVSVDTNSTSLSRGDTIVITQGDAQVLLYVYQLPCYSHEMCQLQVEMTDRERDSWNHASLEVRDLTGATYGTATLISDLASDTAFIGICPSTVNLVWRAGVWDDEAGVVVRNSNGSMLFRHQQGSDFSTELLATISNPCAMSYDCQAANDLPWQEDFEYDIPCWVIKDADGSGKSWSVCDTLPAQSRRASIVAPADASADDWLITPSFTLPDPSYITLSWYVRSDGTQPYSIYVATDTNVRMITDLVYQGQATGSYELRMLTLSQYVGQTIRLAFRRQGTNVGNLQIDNIRLIATNTPTYQLNAVSLSPGMGTTTGTGIYEAGTHVAVRANALFGYRFAFWNDLNTDNPRSVYVDSAITLTAFFAADSFAVVAINRDSAQGHTWGSANYAYRDTATLRATPAHGYHFSQWHDGDTLNPRRVVVEGNANYTAFFAANNYYIDLQPADFMQGSVRGGGTYLYGSIIAISATPRQGYMFSRWSDGDTTNPRFYNVTDSVTLIAEFTLDGHRLSVVSSNEGEGTVSGAGIYQNGSTADIEATPVRGYHFVRWNDGVTSATRTIVVSSDTSFTAYFAIDSYSIKAMSANAAYGSVRGSGSYEYGSTVTLTALPAVGYHFVRWNDADTTNPRVFLAEESGNFTAFFEANEYVVTSYATVDTMGSVSGAGIYTYGAAVTLVATPTAGFRFVQWSNGITANPYRFSIQSDTSIMAVFDSIPVNPAAIGSINMEAISVVMKGKLMTVTGAQGLMLTISDAVGRIVFNQRINSDSQAIALPHNGLFVVAVNKRFHSRQLAF